MQAFRKPFPLLIIPLMLWGAGAAAAADTQLCKDIKPGEDNTLYMKIGHYCTPLQSTGIFSQKYKLEISRLRMGKLKFIGYIDSYNYDVPIAVKLVGWSKNPSVENVKVIHLYRPKIGKRPAFRAKKYSLSSYQKHYYHENKGYFDSTLDRYFYFKYQKKNGRWARTDDSVEKRSAFELRDVPNTFQGGLIAHVTSVVYNYLNAPAAASTTDSSSAEHYVYLRTELRNLRQDSRFEFAARVPLDTSRVDVQITPVDQGDVTGFGQNSWLLEKEPNR